MKNSLTLILVVLGISISYAQDYMPLPSWNGKWVNSHAHLVWEPYPHMEIDAYESYCSPGIDTTISGYSYFVIDNCEGEYQGAMRNSNGKTWFVPHGSQTEYLLYDFTANAGDMLYNIYTASFGSVSNFMLENLYVGIVDSVLINNVHRKRLQFVGSDWIEGIGNTYGLFLETFINVSEYQVNLDCMSDNDTTYYPGYSPVPCGYSTGINDHASNVEQFNIYPNPFTNGFELEYAPECTKLEICDLNGNQILVKNLEQSINSTLRIPTGNLNQGIYILILHTGDKILKKKIVKI